VEIVVALATNFVKGGVLTRFIMNLCHGSRGVLARKNLNRSSRILIATTKVVGTPNGVHQFNNDYFCNRIVDQSPMSSKVVEGYTRYICWKFRKRILRTI
jgi:hypothetical protein